MATLQVAADETKTDRPLRPRRWIPLSLRMFLALLAIAGMGSVWVGVRGYRQLVAIRQLEDLGSDIVQTPAGPLWLRNLVGADRMRMFDEVTEVNYGREATNAGLEHLRGFNRLQLLTLAPAPVTNAGLEHLRGLTCLQELNLSFTQVTDVGLEHLRGLTSLQDLSLNYVQVTDAGLEHLRGLTSLQCLRLDGTRVTDAGLEHLRELTHLEDLSLRNAHVTDVGLEHLQGLNRLQRLYLRDTHVTDAGVAELKRALPDLMILK